MNTSCFSKIVAVLGLAVLAGAGFTGRAVVPPDGAPASAPTANATAPHLAFGVPQVLKLAQGKVSDDTIIAYVKNSGDRYNLDADQILWLRQQGVSDAVLTAMLNQPRAGVVPAQPTMPMPQRLVAPNYPPAYPPASAQYPPPDQNVGVDPSDYSQPYYYYPPSYYYPNYYYPPVIYYYGAYGGYGYRGVGWHGGGGFYGGRRIGAPIGFRSGGAVGHVGGVVGGRVSGGHAVGGRAGGGRR